MQSFSKILEFCVDPSFEQVSLTVVWLQSKDGIAVAERLLEFFGVSELNGSEHM